MTTSQQPPDPLDPQAVSDGPAIAPWQARYIVWLDWAAACFMGGLALGQLAWDRVSRADLVFQIVAIPALLALGEALRRRARWALAPQLVVSAGLAIPFAVGVVAVAEQGRALAEVGAVVGGVILFAGLAAAQLAFLVLPAARRWRRDPRPARIAPWALAALASPALAFGVALQAFEAAGDWSSRSYGAMGIGIRMPAGTQEDVTQRRDQGGAPFALHVLLAKGRLCSYTVSFGRLPLAPDGASEDPIAWREATIRRVTAGSEVLSREPFAGDGRLRVDGEEVKFRSDRVVQTMRVFSPLPRFIVMAKSCYRREPPEAAGFFESLEVYPR